LKHDCYYLKIHQKTPALVIDLKTKES